MIVTFSLWIQASVKPKNFTAEDKETSAPKETVKPKGKAGRPKGSKNRKTLELEAELRAQGSDPDAPKPNGKPERPKGSKNKKHLNGRLNFALRVVTQMLLNQR